MPDLPQFSTRWFWSGCTAHVRLIYTQKCTPTRVRPHALMTYVKIYKIIYNPIGINQKIPEQMNALGKGNLDHYLWVDVAI